MTSSRPAASESRQSSDHPDVEDHMVGNFIINEDKGNNVSDNIELVECKDLRAINKC